MQRVLRRSAMQQLVGFVIAELAYVGLLAILLSIIWFQDRYPVFHELGLSNRGSPQSHILDLTIGAIALSPSLMLIIALIRLWLPRDELQRAVDREALIIACLGAIAFAAFNQASGLIVDHPLQGLLPWFLILPVIGVAWCSGQTVCHLRYAAPT